MSNLPTCETLRLEQAGGRFNLTFDRPRQRNAINRQMAAEFAAVVVEGSAFGGGMGYACLADITIVTRGARFGMPETTLGVAPAQIAPYVVKRIGLTRARQLALTGERFDGAKAFEYGIAQYLCDDEAAEQTLDGVVARISRCGPKANAATKEIMLRVGTMADEEMIRFSAERFARLNRGDEGREGQAAFAEKRKPAWQGDG